MQEERTWQGQSNEKPVSSFQLVQVCAKAALVLAPYVLSPTLQEEKELSRDLLDNDIGFELLPGKHSMEWFLRSVWLHSAKSTQAAGNMTHQQPWTLLMCTQEEPLSLVPATPSEYPATLELVLHSQVLETSLSHA